MNELTTYVLELFGRIESGIIDVTPAALDLALAVVRIDALTALIGGLVAMLVAVVFFVIGRRLFKTYQEGRHYGDVYEDEWRPVIGLMMQGVSFVLLVTFSVIWFNLWTWIAVFQPELALAKEVIGMVTK